MRVSLHGIRFQLEGVLTYSYQSYGKLNLRSRLYSHVDREHMPIKYPTFGL